MSTPFEERSLSFTYHARYYRLGTPATAQKVWFVMHGYGQLAQYFIRKFSVLHEQGIAVVAPEGLSKFYLEDVVARSRGGSQRVGATWMTRENREADIANYLRYLDAVYETECPATHARQVTVLGFSQGAATASRWVLHHAHTVSKLILWAGILPPDMDFRHASEKLKAMQVVSVVGLRDPFATDEKLKEMTELSKKLGIEPELQYFEGAHELNEDLLLQLS
ncbi:MAG: alpha/beta hydrolase [Bacteroidota bacterium]